MATARKTHSVLIVEDDVHLRQALRDKLIRQGFLVLEAKNGLEGQEVAVREHPDLILLDIVMPIMDGITMLTKLREDAWGKEAAVVMLTNLNDNEKLAAAMAQGSYDYLVKSDHKIEDIVRVVQKKLGLNKVE